MRKFLVSSVLIACVFVVAKGQTIDYPDLSGLPQQVQAKGLRYWFDGDTDNTLTVNETSGIYSLDVSALKAGVHTVHYQVVGSDDAIAGISSAVFLKVFDGIAMPASSTASQLRYWFDQDTQVQYSDDVSGVRMVDVSALDDGLHTIHYQIIDNLGEVSTPVSSTFLKFGFSLDVTSEPVQAKSIRYWFDGDETTLQVTDIANTVQTIDLSYMPSGIHTLYYQLVDVNDHVSTPATSVFLKNYESQETEANRITKYEYWMNSDLSSLQTVTIDNAANPYQLTGLFPMPTEQIRSSYFHLEIEDGTPMLYAKNDIHVRFHDARGYFVHDSKPFVDYSVSQAVTDITLLESGVRATTARPAANAIKWYRLDAERGDSLQFKLDYAASLQLFAPSGEEVYSVSGAASVKMGGIHANETGTYYLALHDVTATKGTTVSIDYNLIDKYAILRHDVKLVGNGGCSTITFEGNGFNDLYAVDLVSGTNTINHLYIGHESNATTTVVFDFEGCDLGDYDAVFHFTDGDMNVSNVLTVEAEKPIELETTVKYHREYVVGTNTTNARKVPYTITVKNNGNSTAYRVPIRLVFKSTPGGIVQIESPDVKRASLGGNVDYEGMSEVEIVEMKKNLQEIENDPVAFVIPDTDESDEVNEEAHVVEIFADIPPHSSVSCSFMVKMVHPVKFAYDVPTEYPIVKKIQTTLNDFKEKYCNGLKENLDCMLGAASLASEAVNAVISTVAPGTPLAAFSATTSCVYDFLSTAHSVIGAIVCAGYSSYEENGWKFLADMGSWFSVWHTISQCLVKFIPGMAASKIVTSKNLKIMSTSSAITAEVVNCFNDLLKKKPLTTTPIWISSYDPNDIYGYTAESGSKAVKDGLTDVYYTIEFENDPEVATGPAHDVYVTDVLDATKFDLSTFAPTRIKIGDKTAELSGEPNFVTTIDMRPEIYAIAQVEGTYDESTGEASWHISSLDPMTMEPAEDPYAGVLPVNTDGNGIGELSFDIRLKDGLANGSEIPNSASIVFDTNEAIQTPTWTNVIDRVAPESHITKVEQVDESTATVTVEATDDLSGPWRYDVYVQYGSGAWFLAAQNVEAGTPASVEIYEGIDHGFYVVATDMAGNTEQKTAVRESSLNLSEVILGDVNGDGSVDVLDVVTLVNSIIGKSPSPFVEAAADMNDDNAIDVLDVVKLVNRIIGKE